MSPELPLTFWGVYRDFWAQLILYGCLLNFVFPLVEKIVTHVPHSPYLGTKNAGLFIYFQGYEGLYTPFELVKDCRIHSQGRSVTYYIF